MPPKVNLPNWHDFHVHLDPLESSQSVNAREADGIVAFQVTDRLWHVMRLQVLRRREHHPPHMTHAHRRQPRIRQVSDAHRLTLEQKIGQLFILGFQGYEPDQETIDRILDKISRSGYSSLSKEEKEILFKVSGNKKS